MTLRRYSQPDIKDKKVLLRLDLDVDVNEKGIVDEYHDLRLERAVGTVQELLSFGPKQIIMCGHRGRPDFAKASSGKPATEFSLEPVRDRLEFLLNKAGVRAKIDLISDINVPVSTSSQLVMLENLRFWPGEKNNDPDFARQLSAWGEVYVNDAFGNSHRADASMVGAAQIIKYFFAGPGLAEEIINQEKFLNNLGNPFVLILGGVKISTKLPLIKKFIHRADYVLLGGGLANTVLKSRGLAVGLSVVEESMINEAKALNQDNIVLPDDFIVLNKKSDIIAVESHKIGLEDYILDIGPKTLKKYQDLIKDAESILWNGPMGKFEDKAASEGTMEIAQAMAAAKGNTLAGGGETVIVLERLNLLGQFDFVSAGGGAMLTFLAGETMPALDVLMLPRR